MPQDYSIPCRNNLLSKFEQTMENIAMENKMSEKREVNPFMVANRHGYSSTSAADLEEATRYARQRSWESGEDFGIYKLVAKASSDDLVNTVQVTEVK